MFYVQLLYFLFVFSASTLEMVVAVVQVYDNRCFLENDRPAEIFFVSEDFPVGGVIDTLGIIGDPTENGNISLRLMEQDLPVAFVPNSKNITLTRRLDKEKIDGPSSVNFNVSCDRTNTTDPTFVIPVTLRVTDANDNAPQFLNTPFVLNISEATPVGTRVLQGVKAVDADQPGPFSTVQYSVLPGPYSYFFAFPNRLEGTLLLQNPLNFEKLSNFSIVLRAQDQGSPPQESDTTLQVNVLDADDQNPRFHDERYTAVLPEPPVRGARLWVQPREIAASDQDPSINAKLLYSFTAEEDVGHRLFEIDAASGRVTLRRAVGVAELRMPHTLVLRAAQADNPDRYALATLVVERAAGAGGAPTLTPPAPPPPRFLQRVFSAHVTEPLLPGLRVLTALTNRPHDQRLSFWLGDEGDAKAFSVTSAGDIVLLRPLVNRTQERFSFTVHVGVGESNDSAQVEVEVPEPNLWEPRFRFPQYGFQVSGPARGGAPVGRVEAWDEDQGDAVHLALHGPHAGLFAIDDEGVLTLAGDAAVVSGRDVHLEVVATDSGWPPRQASVPVVVRFAGENWDGDGHDEGDAGADPTDVIPTLPPSAAPLELLLTVLGALLGAVALVVLLLLCLRRLKCRKGRGVVNAEDKGAECNPVYYAGACDDASFAEASYRAMVYTATIKSRARPVPRSFGASDQVNEKQQQSGSERLEGYDPCAQTSVEASPVVSSVTVALVETRGDSVNS